MEQKKIRKISIIVLSIAICVVLILIGAQLFKPKGTPAGNSGNPTAGPTQDAGTSGEKVPDVVQETGAVKINGIPEDGAHVFIYSMSGKGVCAGQTDTSRINVAAGTIKEGLLYAGNGARIFRVEKNGEYYRFFNENDGYLCANGTGSNAFYSRTASNEADWKLIEGNSGVYLESRVAKYKNKYAQYLEYYSSLITTYSMNNPKDYDIYTFTFYDAGERTGLINRPQILYGNLPTAEKGADYTLKFQTDAIYGVKEIKVTVGERELSSSVADGVCRAVIPGELVQGGQVLITVAATDTTGVTFGGEITVAVDDVPYFTAHTPERNTQTGDSLRPVISVQLANGGEQPEIVMTVGGQTVDVVYRDGMICYEPQENLTTGRTEVSVKVTRKDGATAETSWRFTVGEAQYQLYFGQLHSHTEYSDGSGTLESALTYIEGLPENANVDFVAFTDHSNYFDKSGDYNPEEALYDLSKATAYSQSRWGEFVSTIDRFNERQDKVLAIGGFEMTWSGGPGHINTFNTEGIVSRNNKTLNNKTSNAGLQAYYDLLSKEEGADSISQLNHPGVTFGTFADFAYWDEAVDERVHLVEVSNGSGMVGASGYYPSYEYYSMALDRGWHLAPTMNQDNHGGRWGDANDARNVVLAEDLSEESIYDAIRNYRVYATEDKNLELTYTVNGKLLGTQFKETPEQLELCVQFSDPDSSDRVVKAEVVVDSGKTAYVWDNTEELQTGTLSVTLEPDYRYYYIRVTQADGDLAFTAPVWVENH